jgi:hypothetical protein
MAKRREFIKQLSSAGILLNSPFGIFSQINPSFDTSLVYDDYKSVSQNSESLNKLRSGSSFWSRLGFGFDPPLLDKNGSQVPFSDDYDQFAKYHRDFSRAGIMIHTTILSSGWVGINKYNYELTDNTLDALFKDNDNIWYIPRVKLNVPIEWAKANPKELFVYYEGPRNVDDIRSLVDTPKHDLLGYDSATGYYMGTIKRPNVGGLISNQSFASKKWLTDAREALRSLIRHINEGPYADRIIGYHIAYGTSGEAMLWGRGKKSFGDYGITTHKEFFNWGMRNYHTLNDLRKSWLQPDLSEQNIKIPPPEIRENRCDTLKNYFRTNPEDQICIDYERFMSEVNADAIEYFGKIVKEETNGMALSGSFYGYIMEVSNSAYTGHLAIDRILDSPYVDFLASPMSYYRRNIGDPGGEIVPAQSINRKKLFLEELDIRTCLAEKGIRNADNFEETKAIFWREFAKNISHGSGRWWMDLGGGWFDSPEILKEISNIDKVSAEIQKRPGKSISEILVIVDDESIYHNSANGAIHKLFLKEFVREIALCGTPFDLFRLKDAEEIDLSQYKMIIFLNTYFIIPEKWRILKNKIAINTMLVWFYAPGILNPNFDLNNITKITGFNIVECQKKEYPPKILLNMENYFHDTASTLIWEQSHGIEIPLMEVEEQDGQEILGKYEHGGIAAASLYDKQQHLIVYFSLPVMKAEHIRFLGQKAGCNFITPVNCTVYANNRFISVFPKEAINSMLHLKEEKIVFNTVNGTSLENISEIPLHMNEKSAAFFVLT